MASIKISPNAVRLLGRKLYSSHPLVIVVRETLQNSLDACREKGVDPQINLEIDLYKDGRAQFACRDNGCGMSPETITEAFLSLGTTGKGDGGIGGFGIAAAAIFSGSYWKVQTLSWEISSTTMNIDERQAYIDGCIITVEIEDETWRHHHIISIITALTLSQVETHLVIRYEDQVELDTLLGDPILTELDNSPGNPGWVLSGCSHLTLPDYSIGDVMMGGEITGQAVVRLGGLVQFVESSNQNRSTNLVVEITNCPPVNADNYPLSLSRETLNGGIRNSIDKALTPHKTNPVTSHRVVQCPSTQLTVIPGRTLQGSGETSAYKFHAQQQDRECVPQPRAYVDGGFPLRTTTLEPDGRTPLQLRTMLKDYHRSKIPLGHWKALAVWAEIICLLSDEEFGVGLTSDELAVRVEYQGDLYYVLNPTDSCKGLNGTAKVLRLWQLAIHEVAHGRVPSHDESFTIAMDNLSNESAPLLAKHLKGLTRLANNQVAPSWLAPSAVSSQRNQATLDL